MLTSKPNHFKIARLDSQSSKEVVYINKGKKMNTLTTENSLTSIDRAKLTQEVQDSMKTMLNEIANDTLEDIRAGGDGCGRRLYNSSSLSNPMELIDENCL